MELQRGTCFICRNNSVLKPSQSQKAHQIISLLFAKVINTTEYTNVQSALRVCPICYHKLIIMKRTSKYVEKNISNEVSSGHCRLCKTEKNLFQINNWPSFSAISEEMGFGQKKNCITCSDCLFYLETKNELKKKLFSKYPQLENKPLNNNRDKKKWKLKFAPDAKLQSTPLSERNKRTRSKRKLLEIISISDDDLESEKTVNSNPFKNLKPLKNHKLYKNNKAVKMDSKFLNQIPYVLVNSFDLSNKCNDTINKHVIKYTEDGKNENCKEPDENTVLEKLTKELVKHGIEKRLVVNIPRIQIEEYQGCESDPDIQNLIDKFSILHSSNETKENGSDIFKSSLIETQNTFVEETETSFEIKNKRKSVSFAEERNVEIEYFENESNLKFKNHYLDEDSEVISKKQSKGILKREESMEEQNITLEEQNKKIELKEKVHDKPSDKIESEKNAQDQKDKDDEILKNKIYNRRNSYLIDENVLADNFDSDSDIEVLSQILKKSIQDKAELIDISENDGNNMVEEGNTSYKEKAEIGKEKPKLLSRKKRRNTVTENIDDDSDDEYVPKKMNDHKVTIAEQSSENKTKSDKNIETNTEDNIVSVSIEEKVENKVFKKEKPKPLSKKKKLNADKPDSEDILGNSNDCDATTSEQPLQNENKSEERNEISTEDNIGSVSIDEKVENKATKKEKPKPQSKKKKLNVDNSEDILEKSSDCDATTSEQASQNENKSEEKNKTSTQDNIGSVCIDEIVENKATKKEKPKPLSKKKKLKVDKFKDVDKEISSECDIDIDKDNEIGNESVSEGKKATKDRPKPHSKKKILDDTSGNIKADTSSENNLSNNKDEGDLDDSDKEKPNTKNISSEKDNQDDLEEQVLPKDDNQIEDDQGTDKVIEINKDKSTEDEASNSDKNISAEKEKNSLDPSLEDKSYTNDSLGISEYCKEVLEKDEENTISKDSERSSGKTDTMSDNDVSLLVNKYLINEDEDGSSVLNTQKDDTLEESTNRNSDQIQTEDNKEVGSECKLACSPIETFNEFKSDDLGISEIDNENINSILSNMFPSDLSDKLFESKSDGKPETDSTENTNQDLKRKISDDELNTSKERKKKKVTFCDNVT